MAAEGPAKKKIGVLALQGDFEAHAKALARAGADVLAEADAIVHRNLDAAP